MAEVSCLMLIATIAGLLLMQIPSPKPAAIDGALAAAICSLRHRPPTQATGALPELPFAIVKGRIRLPGPKSDVPVRGARGPVQTIMGAGMPLSWPVALPCGEESDATGNVPEVSLTPELQFISDKDHRSWGLLYVRPTDETFVFEGRLTSWQSPNVAVRLRAPGKDAWVVGQTSGCDAVLIDARGRRVWELHGDCRNRRSPRSFLVSSSATGRTAWLKDEETTRPGDALDLDYARFLESGGTNGLVRVPRTQVYARLVGRKDLTSLSVAVLMTEGSSLNPDAVDAMSGLQGWVRPTEHERRVMFGPFRGGETVLAYREGGWDGELPEIPRSVAQANQICALCLFDRGDVMGFERDGELEVLGSLGDKVILVATTQDSKKRPTQIFAAPSTSLWPMARWEAAVALRERAKASTVPLWLYGGEDPGQSFEDLMIELAGLGTKLDPRRRAKACELQNTVLEGASRAQIADMIDVTVRERLGDERLAARWRSLCSR